MNTFILITFFPVFFTQKKQKKIVSKIKGILLFGIGIITKITESQPTNAIISLTKIKSHELTTKKL